MDYYGKAIKTVRFLSVDAVERANSGHPGTPMALATIAVELFANHLNYLPDQPDWPNRDRFVLSAGHASMLLYSVLYLSGYDLPLDELKRFRQLGSKTPGHPEHGLTPGVETTTGPLGQGFGNAVGMALAGKMAGARVNQGGSNLIDYRVYAIASDGDLMEGVSSEAASIAGHLGLDNLIVFYDDNAITIDGSTELAFSEDVEGRFRASGWAVQRIDGHDRAQVAQALERAKEEEQPSLIIAKTRIAIGAPNKEGTSAAHGAPLGKDEVRATKQAAGWPEEPDFVVPDGATEPFRRRVEVNRRVHQAWKRAVDELPEERARVYESVVHPKVPDDLFERLLAAAPEGKDATRSHGAKIQQRAAELVPAMVGGAADLVASTKTTVKTSTSIARGEYAGRNIHFGIREHAMGSITNGLALSGFFLPYASTFLIFSDYMRPPMRLAALMEQPVTYVFTHDSIFVGEDGPTHEPVEQVWALRLIPNLDVVRPADGLECAAAWSHALTRKDGPTALCLSRQAVPALARRDDFDPRELLNGAYVLTTDDDPEFVLVATGSEVGVAVDAKKLLNEKGRRLRVVSAPCLDAFARLSDEKREAVLPRRLRTVTLEAGVTAPWASIGGRDDIHLGVDRFGASAPYQELARAYGLTAQQVADAILERL